jgi:hypothetical protein
MKSKNAHRFRQASQFETRPAHPSGGQLNPKTSIGGFDPPTQKLSKDWIGGSRPPMEKILN